MTVGKVTSIPAELFFQEMTQSGKAVECRIPLVPTEPTIGDGESVKKAGITLLYIKQMINIGPTVRHRGLCSLLSNDPCGNEWLYVNYLLSCIAETNTTL